MEKYEITPVASIAFNGIVADEINRLNRELKLLKAESDQWKRIADILAVCIEDFFDESGIEPNMNIKFALSDHKQAFKEYFENK